MEAKAGIGVTEKTPFGDFGTKPTGKDRFLGRLRRLDFKPSWSWSSSVDLVKDFGFKMKAFLGIGVAAKGSVSP